MTRLIIDTAENRAEQQETERIRFLERARAHLAILDANSFQSTDREEILSSGNRLLRVDGTRGSWNRMTMFLRDLSHPTINIVLPSMLTARMMCRTRFDAARSIASLAIMISEKKIIDRSDAIREIREVVDSATLAASAASGRPTAALLPTPWWPCMEHWSLRTRPESGGPRGGPVDDFLAEAGSRLEGVVEAEWRTTERGLCQSLVVLAASCRVKRADEDPLAAMRALERWRPALRRAGLS